MITRSEYTHTDPVLSTPVPQPVKTFTDAGTQVELISESPGGANRSPSGHSSHVKVEKKKILREFTLSLDQLIAINLTKRNKNLKKIKTLTVNQRNSPSMNKSIHQMRSLQMIHHFLPQL